jgi:hypothetical protein
LAFFGTLRQSLVGSRDLEYQFPGSHIIHVFCHITDFARAISPVLRIFRMFRTHGMSHAPRSLGTSPFAPDDGDQCTLGEPLGQTPDEQQSDDVRDVHYQIGSTCSTAAISTTA